MSELIALGTLAVGAYGTAKTIDEQKKAYKAEVKARDAQKRIRDIRIQRERTNMIREARIKRAQIMQAGQNAGVGVMSSPVQGGASSLQSQLAANLGLSQQVESLGNQANTAYEQAAAAQQAAATYAAGASAAMNVGQQFGNYDFQGAYNKYFKPDY